MFISMTVRYKHSLKIVIPNAAVSREESAVLPEADSSPINLGSELVTFFEPSS
jgi:hypothetical protein